MTLLASLDVPWSERVVVVADVEAAIAHCQTKCPTVLLLDGGLQATDSLVACETLRQVPALRSLPILMLVEATFDRAMGFRCGMTDFVLRPLQRQEVCQRLAALHPALTAPSMAHLQQQIEHQDYALQQANESLKLLLHAVSHDLRNPVLGMQMVFQNLLNGTCQEHWSDEEMIAVPRSFIERMVQGSDRHLNLISALIDSHSTVTRPLALNRQRIDLSSLIATVLQELEPWLRKNQASVATHIPPHLPAVDADPIQISRVIKHLVENALQHNPPGVRLQVSAAIDHGALCCVVQDNGQGIRAEDCDRLFRLSQRGDRAGHTFGLGLGLYLCQQIVQAHGGTIHVANVPEGGARFWFMLPQTAPHSCDRAIAPATPEFSLPPR